MDMFAPEVHASASPSQVRLGDRFTVFVTATFAAGVEVNLREPVDLGGTFEVRRRDSEDKARADGKRVREWQLDVIAWDVGDLQQPPIAITFTAAGHAGQVATEPVPIRVFGPLADPDDPKALRPAMAPTTIYERDWFWLELGAIAGSVIAAALAVLWIRARRRRRTLVLTGGRVEASGALDSPSTAALERLLAIEASGMLARDRERKRGYAQMVEVIRDYIAARYRVATLDLTTSELVRKLTNVVTAEERGRMKRWLEACDLVKYAGERVSAAAATAALEAARELVIASTEAAARAAEPVHQEAA
jgi:hypothetical protein